MKITHQYEMEMCIGNDLVCEPFSINFPSNFKLMDIEVESADGDSLAHICSCEVIIDDNTVYSGLIGSGFGIAIDIETCSSMKIIPDCKLLKDLVDDAPSCKISVTGKYFNYGEQEFEESFSSSWC